MSDGQAAAMKSLKLTDVEKSIIEDASARWDGNKKELDDLLSRIPSIDNNLILLNDALSGGRGEDQERIAKVGLQWLSTLLKKNHDYDSSVWSSPALLPDLGAGDSILVRMSDKISRLTSLKSKGNNEVADESYNDTIGDLGSYCLLYLARPE